MRQEKESVRQFYETFGWKREQRSDYGEADFNDLRDVTGLYNLRSNLRVRAALPRTASLFLDAACGARPQSLLWKDPPDVWPQPLGIRRQVCADMSRTGLAGAREQLGDAAVYIEADVTALPFKDGAFDAFICAHALYHVPAEEQELVVRELYRTLAPEGTGVILYAGPLATPMNRAVWKLGRIKSRIRRTFRRDSAPPPTQETGPDYASRLYSHYNKHTWWDRFRSEMDIDVRSLAAVDQEFTTRVIPDNRFGVAILRAFSFLEEKFPYAMVKLGRYQMVVLRKK